MASAEQSTSSTQKGVCDESGMCYKITWCIFSPFILIWHSIDIYLIPCFVAYLSRCLWTSCCFLCACCRSCFLYKDKSFPGNNESLGRWHDKSREELDAEICWRRAEDIFPKASGTEKKCCSNSFALVSGKVEPKDVAQGQLGDCWLMSALACLAEHPGAIRNAFISREYNARGKYQLRLYDKPNQKWNVITLDDFFPVNISSNQPIFAQPQGNEVWVLLMEKAFAKTLGTYANLKGGLSLYALQALTGDEVLKFTLDASGSTWQRFNLTYLSSNFVTATDKVPLGLAETEEKYGHMELFEIIKEYDRHKSVMGAGTNGTDDSKSENGLVAGHAYSIVKVVKEGEFRMVCLRNPWGTFEWEGAWSDKSPLWDEHSSVKKACKENSDANDGVFWMCWEDFVKHFKTIDVCSRTTGFGDLALDVREDEGCIGPCKGCFFGCLHYYCCCRGCVKLCCQHKTSATTLNARRQACCVCV